MNYQNHVVMKESKVLIYRHSAQMNSNREADAYLTSYCHLLNYKKEEAHETEVF